MNIKKFALFILILSTLCSASDQSDWEQLYALNAEEIKMLNTMKNKRSHMQYRLFELYSEKAKLEKQRENKAFIQNKLKRKNLSRKSAFKETLLYYRKSKRLANQILKQFPKTRLKADIYYSMALNSRDFAYDKKTEYYLKLALKNSNENDAIHYQSLVSLAEHYYNSKKYKKAVKTYELVIVNTNDSWHTKNLLNYGWCLFKAGKVKQAIYTLKTSYNKSSNPLYINIKPQVIEGLSIFFVHNHSIKDGADFFIKNEKDAEESLNMLYSKLSRKGTLKSLDQLLNITIGYFNQMQKNTLELEINKLEIYKRYKSESKFHKQLNLLKSKKLANQNKMKVNGLIKNVVGLMQIRLAKSYDHMSGSYQQRKYQRVLSYYNSMIYFDPKNQAHYTFLKAESQYGVHLYKDALVTYIDALEIYKKSPSNKDIRRKIIEAVFSCIELSKLKDDYKKSQLAYGYKNFLIFWPKDKKAPLVNEKYIRLLAANGEIAESEQYLQAFHNNFNSLVKVQRELLNMILDKHIKNEKSVILAGWLLKLQKGYLKFSARKIQKLEQVHTNILFNKYHELTRKKEYEKALIGYEDIFNNPHYSTKIKSKASYFLIITNARIFNYSSVVDWYKTNREITEKKVFNSHQKVFSEIQDQLISSQDLQSSIEWNTIILSDFCQLKSKVNDSLIERQLDLANVLDIDFSYKTFDKNYRKCSNSTNWYQLGEKHLKNLYEKNKFTLIDDFLNVYSKNNEYKEINEKLIIASFDHHLANKTNSLEAVTKRLTRLNCKSCIQRVLSFQEAILLLNEVEHFKGFKFKFKKVFNNVNFNQQLEGEIERIQSLIARVEHIKDYHFYYSTLHSMASLSISLKNFADELSNIQPPIHDQQLNSSFKIQMKSLAQNFKMKANEYRLKAQLLVQNEKLIVKDKYIQSFIAKTFTNQLLPSRFFALKNGLME